MADLVAAVTNPEYAPDRDTDEQYREHVADSLRRNPWARIIKASDFTDNGVGLIHTHRPAAAQARWEVRAAGSGLARADRPARYPA